MAIKLTHVIPTTHITQGSKENVAKVVRVQAMAAKPLHSANRDDVIDCRSHSNFRDFNKVRKYE